MKYVVMIFAGIFVGPLWAVDGKTEEAINIRQVRKIGFQVINMGAPYQQTLGVGAGVNFAPQGRARIIYAPGLTSAPNQGIDTLQTVVASLDGFLFNRPLSPIVSLQVAGTSGSPQFGDVFGKNARHLLLAVGADFLRQDGLNAGVTLNLPINEPISGISFYLGWYSDIF